MRRSSILAPQLVIGGTQFTKTGRFGGGRAHVHFAGVFQGSTVTWDAWIYTLQFLHDQTCAESDQADPHESRLRQFIEVGELKSTGMQLRVGLAVSKIDRRVVLKTMIMIRQYQHLRRGRHEYGPIHSLRSAQS